MNEKSDALEQFNDLIAGAMYDIANEGLPEDDELYEVFRLIASELIDMFEVQVVASTGPLRVVLTLK